jgi:hypothetical protein
MAEHLRLREGNSAAREYPPPPCGARAPRCRESPYLSARIGVPARVPMGEIDRQPISAVKKLHELGLAWHAGDWRKTTDAQLLPEADRMHALLVRRADELEGCIEGSPDEAELASIVDAIMASPSSSRATKRRRSSTTEPSFQGIATSRLPPVVADGKCYPCVRYDLSPMSRAAQSFRLPLISAGGCGAARAEAGAVRRGRGALEPARGANPASPPAPRTSRPRRARVHG